MDFSDLIAANNNTFGESITYSPDGGTASTITVIIDRDAQEEEDADDGTHVVKRAMLIVQASDIAAPDLKDRVTFDSVIWSVYSIQKIAGGDAFELGVVRAVSTERSRQGYRRSRGQ